MNWEFIKSGATGSPVVVSGSCWDDVVGSVWSNGSYPVACVDWEGSSSADPYIVNWEEDWKKGKVFHAIHCYHS